MTILAETCARWRSAERPFFGGRLIDDNGCCCAQGDVLRASGWEDQRLRSTAQNEADCEVARLLGISRAHSALLRHVNDSKDGCPQDVLDHPERVLGDRAELVLAFWRRLDAMTQDDWNGATAAAAAAEIDDDDWYAARDAAWYATGAAVRAAARSAARSAAGDAAGDPDWYAAEAAGLATNEVQGAALMRERGQPFFFLPLFGVDDPAELEESAA
jgi:hypothetical protein